MSHYRITSKYFSPVNPCDEHDLNHGGPLLRVLINDTNVVHFLITIVVWLLVPRGTQSAFSCIERLPSICYLPIVIILQMVMCWHAARDLLESAGRSWQLTSHECWCHNTYYQHNPGVCRKAIASRRVLISEILRIVVDWVQVDW